MCKSLVTFTLCVGVTLAASGVWAQTAAEMAERQRLINQALTMRTADEHGQALALALQAERIAPSPSLLMFIAQEHQSLGDMVSAWTYAQNCVGLTENTSNVDDRERLLRRCREIRQATEQETALIELVMGAEVPRSAVVTVAGRPITPGEWGIPQRAPSGNVVVEVAADGYELFRERLAVQPRSTRRVEVRLSRSSSSGPTNVGTVSAPGTCPGAAPRVECGRSHTPLPWVLIGVGVAGAGLAVTAGLAANYWEDENKTAQTRYLAETRNRPWWSDRFRITGENATTWNTIFNVAVGAGSAALVSGVLWLVYDRTSGGTGRVRSTVLSVHPLAQGGAMLNVGGAL